MGKSRVISFVVQCIIALMLVGCDSNEKMDDLKQFMVDAKNSFKAKAIELPKLNLKESQIYKAHRLKNPFMKQEDKNGTSDDPLQNYSVEKMQLRGVLAKEDKYWAAIELPNGSVLEVSVGARIGQHKGVIHSITPERVKIVEKVRTETGRLARREVELKVLGGS